MRRLLLVGGAALAALGAVPAQACGVSDLEAFAVYDHESGADGRKSLSGTLCGYSLNITSQYSYDDVKALSLSSWTFQVNGHTVTVSTTGPLQTADRADTFTVTVDGRQLYSGPGTNLDIQDGINLLSLIGIADVGSVAQQQVARSEARMVTSMVSNRISGVLGGARAAAGQRQKTPAGQPAETGVSGGDADHLGGLGLWATPSNSWVRNTDPFAAFQGTLQNGLFGADYKLTDRFIVGVALGLEHTLVHSRLNGGRLEAEGASLTPYMALSFLDNTVVWNMMAGAAMTGNRVSRQAGDTRVTGKYLSNRYMVSTNLDANVALSDQWVLTPRTGLMIAWDHRRQFTESDGTRPLKNDSALMEGKFGGRLTYLGDGFDLFGGADYLHDFFHDQDITAPNDEFDRNEVLLSVGLSWYPDDGEVLGLEILDSVGRDYTREWTMLANYRKTF